MQRYFVEEENISLGQQLCLNDDDNHHLVRVMRAQAGQSVYLVAADHQVFKAELIEVGSDQVAVLEVKHQVDQSAELPVAVTIAAGLSKGDKLDWLVQKATECGVSQIIPLALKRDVVRWDGKKSVKKIERLQRIAKEAAEQSHRNVIPALRPLMTLEELVGWGPDSALKLVAYEETAKAGQHGQLKQALGELSQALDAGAHPQLIMVFGSEGGLEPAEVEQLQAAGYQTCSLGPRILRAETAPLYLLNALSCTLEL